MPASWEGEGKTVLYLYHISLCIKYYPYLVHYYVSNIKAIFNVVQSIEGHLCSSAGGCY